MTLHARRTWLLGAVALLVGGRHGNALSAYPPVKVLEDQLPCHPGDPLPRLISYRGRTFQPRYVSAEARANGIYIVTLKLA